MEKSLSCDLTGFLDLSEGFFELLGKKKKIEFTLRNVPVGIIQSAFSIHFLKKVQCCHFNFISFVYEISKLLCSQKNPRINSVISEINFITRVVSSQCRNKGKKIFVDQKIKKKKNSGKKKTNKFRENILRSKTNRNYQKQRPNFVWLECCQKKLLLICSLLITI